MFVPEIFREWVVGGLLINMIMNSIDILIDSIDIISSNYY